MSSGIHGVFSVFAATIEPVGQEYFRANSYVAFGECGEVLLTEWDHIYLYQHDGMNYSRPRKTCRPDTVSRFSYKAVSSRAIFLQDALLEDVTHMLSLLNLQPMDQLHHKGALRGAIQPSTLVYSLKRDDKDYIIILYRPNGDMILQPPHGRKWNSCLSVCRAGEFFVVVEHYTRTLDVFCTRGNILLLFCHI